MPPKAGRGRKKAAKQETLDQFVKPKHDENNKEVSDNKLIDIDVVELKESNTNSIDAAKSKSENSNELEFSQMNGIKESPVNGSIEEISNNGKIGASLANDESTTISEEKVSEEIPDKPEKKEENVPSDDNEVKSDVPMKRGRKNKTENSKTSNENKETVDDPPIENKSEIPMKRGRRNKTENSKITNENKEMVNDAPEENSNEVKSEVPVKRARRNKTENSKVTNENKETVESPEENVEQNKRTRAGRNKKQSNAIRLEEASKVDQKKKNSSDNDSEENVFKTDISDIVERKKFLQVHIIRDKELDERSLKEAEIAKSAKGGSKRATKRKSTGNEDNNEQESDKKPAKIPKKLQSKGQSKKDKMPDVTQLNFENTSKSPNGKPWNLKISSWNVNGVRAWIEKDGLAYLQHESPDILCVQETKCSDNKLPKELDVDGYKHYCLAGDKDGYSGVALFTKEEPLSIKYGIGVKAHDNEGRVITAEYEKFFLVCAYVPNAGRGLVRLNYRMEWDKDFLSYLMSLDEKKPVILCGDLNVAHEEIDLANPKSNKKNAGFTKEEREGFSTLLSEGNFIDTFRHLYPDQKGAYTFWTYMMNARAKNVGWRLDYFIMSKRFIDHLCDQVIRKDVYGSDHCPITLFLAL